MPSTTEIATNSSTISSIPSLHSFDTRHTTWECYRDRVSFYFKANHIEQEADKKALFLWSVGDASYHLLQSLLSPKSLTGDDVSYADIIKVLNSHYNVNKNIMTSTYDFYSCNQKADQTFNEWKAELCAKLRHCGFTTSKLKDKPQDRALRDMYIIGIRSSKIRQALLKEEDPDLATTERIIQLAERLEEDVRHFGGGSLNAGENVVSKIHKFTPKRQAPQQINSSPKGDVKPCESCGSKNHIRSSCKFRDLICNFCKRNGHIERACRSKQRPSSSTKHITTIFSLADVNYTNPVRISSSTVLLRINRSDLNFELDTGSIHTIISMKDWSKIGSPPIHPCKSQLKCYSGKLLNIKGQCDVAVDYDGKLFNLHIIVIDGVGPPLLGLQWIKMLQLDLNLLVHGQNHVTHDVHKLHHYDKLQVILDKYQNVLNAELGHCTKVQARIQLKPDAIPKFFKPRPLPFAYLDAIKEEIQRNVDIGILQRVDVSQWATPIVPVKKPNGKVRICGDFKVTINSQMLIDQHPIPSIDELLTRLKNGERYSKLDLSDAYFQIDLDEESKKLVVINTPLGLFRYNRLPFGVANAPALFQRVIDQVIAGIPNCAAYLDDILITGATETEHLQTLENVLMKLADFGFTCNPNKCSFFKKEVSYLGFIINKDGKQPDPQRVKAIVNMPAPANVKEVEAFIGKVNYYGRFIPNLSDKCKPLNRLRHLNTSWSWSKDCQTAFDNLRNEISKVTTLVHFNSSLPIILATDASNYGIGAVLMHRFPDESEKPIAHVSKTLSAAEKNYSQIEKEALSIIYGVKKFHQYLAGRKFELITDHQPLLTIFNPTKPIPVATANRLQRWAIFLMGYSYNIRYKSTRLHANADALSRLPAGPDETFRDEDAYQIHAIQEQIIDGCIVDAIEISAATDTDDILKLVKQFILHGWSNSSKSTSPALLPYYNNRQLLSVVNGCILKDAQVIIPQQLQRRVLQMLHHTHLGTVKMKQLARSHCWWPSIDKDILEISKSCDICARSQPAPRQEYKSWSEPENVWSRVHMDFAGPVWGSKWLLIIDAKSKFPIVADMNNDTSAANLSNVLDQVFDWFGPPELLVSDNGPPFNSYEMKNFYRKYGITHVTSAPYHPASNGIAERFVRSFKESMLKEQQSGQSNKHLSLRNVLRTYRWTPHTTTGLAPANMMLQHTVRTELTRMKPIPKPVQQQQQAKFTNGQLVWSSKPQPNKRPEWKPAIVIGNLGSMVYEVQLNDGQHLKRHQNQLRLRYSNNRQSSDVDSLPDDLTDSNTQPQPQATTATPPTSPRYPRRNRQPPDRFTPS